MSDILLVHGSCHGAWCWRDLIPALQELGHSPRAIDLPSHGDDTTPVNAVTLDSYAEAICDALGPRTLLLGHSAAGFAITAAAERRPERIARLIETGVLAQPATAAATPAGAARHSGGRP